MSRHLGRLFLWLALILFLAVVARRDPGYVLLSWGTTSIEMSLILASVLWLLSLWVVVKLADFERWLVRVWRSDWSRFWGLGRAKVAEPGEKLDKPAGKA